MIRKETLRLGPKVKRKVAHLDINSVSQRHAAASLDSASNDFWDSNILHRKGSLPGEHLMTDICHVISLQMEP